MRRLLVAVVLLFACAACDGSPADPPAPSQQKTVDLTGVDPCDLLTAEQRAALGLDRPPVAMSSYSLFYRTDADECGLRTSRSNETTFIMRVDNTGIDRYDDPDLTYQVERLTEHGLAVLLLRPTHRNTYCSVVIGTSPGHLINIDTGYHALEQSPVPQQELCDHALGTARAVLATIDR